MIWIVGTSVSIQHGGYVTRLVERVQDELGAECCNLSVGDQNSLMGCMRVLANCDQIRPGDVVIWEYSLLDTILDDGMFAADDVRAARRMAWNAIHGLGARVLVLLVPPRDSFKEYSTQEMETIGDAHKLGLEYVEVRSIFSSLGLIPDGEYSDDRHLRLDSLVLDALVERLVVLLDGMHGHKRTDGKPVSVRLEAPDWYWMGAEELAAVVEGGITECRNSLMTVSALELPVDGRVELPKNDRIVAVGIISTHMTGGVWCGHSGCAPAATRLPAELDHAFLLRATPVPCVRAQVECLAAAPTWAYRRGVWAAYGQELSEEPAPVMIFGVLFKHDTEECETAQAHRGSIVAGWTTRLRSSRDTLLTRTWRKFLRRVRRPRLK